MFIQHPPQQAHIPNWMQCKSRMSYFTIHSRQKSTQACQKQELKNSEHNSLENTFNV